MGDPSLATRDGRSRSSAARVPCDALRCRPKRRLRRAGVRQGPRARFRRAAIASVALRPHGQGVSPAPLATPRATARRLHESRGVPRSPRGHKNPRGSRLAVCVERARLRFGVARRAWGGASARATSRWIAIAAPDCAFRRPRRLQPTTLPVAALWMAAPYHPVTRAARRFLLAISLPPLARRPILAPVTTRFATRALDCWSGSDRRHARRTAPEPSPAERRAGRIAQAAAFAPVRAGRNGDTTSAPSARGAAGVAMRTPGSVRISRSRPHGRSFRRCARNARSCSRC